MKELFRNSNDLASFGFEEEEEETSDSTRWVLFRKRIEFGNSGYYILIKVTYLRSISDKIGVSYTDNIYDSFEDFVVGLYDENDNELATNVPVLNKLDDINDINCLFD